MQYIGIDPGKSGAIVVIDDDGIDFATSAELLVRMLAMPQSPVEMVEILEDEFGIGSNDDCKCIVERVQGYVGGKGEPGSAMFKFGFNYGMILTGLAAINLKYEEIQPQVWQRSVGVPPRKNGEAKAKFKNRLKTKAASLGLPLAKSLTLKTCDALLIAWYCYQLNTKVRGRL